METANQANVAWNKQQARKARDRQVIDYESLVKGNILAKKWARQIMGRRKLGKFLSVLYTPCRAESLGVPQSQVEQIMAISPTEKEAIFVTKALTEQIFIQFDKLALRIARNFARLVGRDNEADVTQLESEARVGLLKAIRGYTKLETKFVTFCHKVMSNEVSRYLQRAAGVTLTGANASLLVRYKRKVEEMSKASLPHSFEDVCRALDLSVSQAQRLADALRSEVTSESELETALASTLLDKHRSVKVDGDLIRKLNRAALDLLSDIERDAWIAQSEDIRQMFPAALPSLKDVAERYGKTPQAASEALKRARRKLAAALGDDWNPQA